VREGLSWYIIDFITVVHRSVNSGKKSKNKISALFRRKQTPISLRYFEAPSQKCTLNDDSIA